MAIRAQLMGLGGISPLVFSASGLAHPLQLPRVGQQSLDLRRQIVGVSRLEVQPGTTSGPPTRP